MRHAYLILAHNNFKQLSKLVSLLDDRDNDIFIHIDKKSNILLENLSMSFNLKFSKVHIYNKYKIYWGHYSMVEAEIFLFEESSKIGYDYYHLISGLDLPIKSMNYIKEFFEKNSGKEFVLCDESFSKQTQVKRRAKYYYHLQKYRKNRNSIIAFMANLFNKIDIFIQMILRINRLKSENIQLMAGSQWVSITNDFVIYLLEKKSLIKKLFIYSNCSDELFVQTILYNSNFKNKLYTNEENGYDNMRKILWENNNSGSPYVWKNEDFNNLANSRALFARKFDSQIDNEIINLIANYVVRYEESIG